MPRLFWGLLVFFVLLGTGLIVFARYAGRSARIGGGIVESWVDDVKHERYDEAYAKLAAAYRETVPVERFRAGIAKNAYLRGMKSLRIYRTSAGSDQVVMNGSIKSSAGRVDVTFHLARDSRGPKPEWGLNGVVVAGTPALPAP